MKQAKKDILVVDDDLAHRTMLKTLLSGWGFRITEADDGETAMTAVQEQPFDLVLMDIRMLKMSGLEALTGNQGLQSLHSRHHHDRLRFCGNRCGGC